MKLCSGHSDTLIYPQKNFLYDKIGHIVPVSSFWHAAPTIAEYNQAVQVVGILYWSYLLCS